VSVSASAASTPQAVNVTVTQRTPNVVIVERSSPADVLVGASGGPGLDVTVSQPEPHVITIGGEGPAGPPGAPGASGAASALIVDQPTPSDQWVIVHNFGRYPAFIVVDEAGQVRPFVPAVNVDENTLVLSPNPPLAGKVVLI
jgi:hypothetical protein